MSQQIINLRDLDKVAFLDPASGKAPTRRMSARSAIVVLGQDHHQRIFVLHQSASRLPTQKLVEHLFEINRNFKPRIFGGEADALQTLFQDAIKLIAADRNEKLPLVPITHSTRLDKDFRIRTTLQPVIAEGRLILREDQHELLAELEGFPSYPTKDLVDALASAINLLPQRTTKRVQDESAQALASYLRRTGAPSWYIERKCGEAGLSQNPLRAMLTQQGRLRRPIPAHLKREAL